jgi:hypothetical protein
MEDQIGAATANINSMLHCGCGRDATPVNVTGSTTKVSAGDFRCDIKGLEAESAKLNEDFRRAAARLPSSVQ